MASRRKKRLAQADGDGHSDNETEEWEAREGGGFVRIYPPTTLKRVHLMVEGLNFEGDAFDAGATAMDESQDSRADRSMADSADGGAVPSPKRRKTDTELPPELVPAFAAAPAAESPPAAREDAHAQGGRETTGLDSLRADYEHSDDDEL